MCCSAAPERDQMHTDGDWRASTLHFLKFPFTDAQVANFREPDAEIILGIGHVHYFHMARLPEAVRSALAEDFA